MISSTTDVTSSACRVTERLVNSEAQTLAVCVRRGFIAGLAGGTASAVFLLLVGERVISAAVRLEEVGGAGGDERFSREVQMAGGAVAMLLVGAAIGVVFAVTFVAVRSRLPGRTDQQRCLVWAATAWVVVYAVPFAKFPPNPPGVGDAGTIHERTALYLAMIAWSIGAAWCGARVGARLRGHKVAPWARIGAATTTWLVLLGLGYLLLPARPDAVEVPVELVWRFRLASAAGTAMLWAVTGLVFGKLLRAATVPARHGAVADPGARDRALSR